MIKPPKLAPSHSDCCQSSPLLMPPLRLFEVLIVVRFLTPREKLLIMALLNRQWHCQILKHYSWVCLPKFGLFTLKSQFISLFDGFTELTRVDVPHFPGELLTSERMSKLSSAANVVIKDLTQFNQFIELA